MEDSWCLNLNFVIAFTCGVGLNWGPLIFIAVSVVGLVHFEW